MGIANGGFKEVDSAVERSRSSLIPEINHDAGHEIRRTKFSGMKKKFPHAIKFPNSQESTHKIVRNEDNCHFGSIIVFHVCLKMADSAAGDRQSRQSFFDRTNND